MVTGYLLKLINEPPPRVPCARWMGPPSPEQGGEGSGEINRQRGILGCWLASRYWAPCTKKSCCRSGSDPCWTELDRVPLNFTSLPGPQLGPYLVRASLVQRRACEAKRAAYTCDWHQTHREATGRNAPHRGGLRSSSRNQVRAKNHQELLRRGVEPILFLGPQRVQSCQHRDLSRLASSTGGCISEVQLPRWWYFVMAAPGNSPTCSNRASRDRAQASSRRFNFRWVFHPPDPSFPTYCIAV